MKPQCNDKVRLLLLSPSLTTDHSFPSTGGLNLESCGQLQRPVGRSAGLSGDGGAEPLHLWLDAQRDEAAQPGPVQVGASTRFLWHWHQDSLQGISPCFRDAVESVGRATCARPATRQLRSLAVSAFGPPSGWDEAEVSALGNLIGTFFFFFNFLCS